jgi:hypothetical protein
VNTLEQLNQYANTLVHFTDDRPYAVTFSGALTTANVNSIEGASIAPYFDGTFTQLQGMDTATSPKQVLTLELDFSNAVGSGSGPQITWATPTAIPYAPSNTAIAFSEPSEGVFRATNIVYLEQLTELLTDTRIELVDQDVNFTYNTKVIYPDPTNTAVDITKTQAVNITITSSFDEMTVPASTTQELFSVETNVVLTDNALITDTETDAPSATYTMRVEPSVTNSIVFSASESGTSPSQSSTITAYGSNGGVQLVGTKAQINADIELLKVSPYSGFIGTTSINYTLINTLSGVNSTGSTTGFQVSLLEAITNVVTRTYTENTINTDLFATNTPVLNSQLDTVFGDASYVLQLNVGNAYKTFKKFASGSANEISGTPATNTTGWLRSNAWSSGKAGYQLFYYQGSRAEIDTILSSAIEYIPPGGVSSTQTLYMELYRVSNPSSDWGPSNPLISIKSYNFSVTGTADASAVPGVGVTSYTTANNLDTIDITDAQRFFLKTDILIVGAGGYGGAGASTSNGGGGGGAGELTYIDDSDLYTANNIERVRLRIADAPAYGSTSTETSSIVQNFNNNVYSGDLIQALNGGNGGDADATAGNNGTNGGYTGGGGAPNGLKGPTLQEGTNTVSTFTGTVYDPNGLGSDAGSVNGGNGGGAAGGYSNNITGSSVEYIYPGIGGGDGGTSSTVTGSGGDGGVGSANTGRTDGSDGIIIIKHYEF